MKTRLLMLVLCFLAVSLNAQNHSSRYQVKGVLIDSVAKEPVAYATIGITLKQTPEKKVKMLVTDANGKFTETLAAEGEYLITLSSVGYKTVERSFEVSAQNKVADLGSLYTTEDVEELGGVTVTAQKPLVKVDIDKIAYDVASDPDAEAHTVLDILRKVPLVTVDGEDNIKLNGKSNFKIHLNGRPSNLLTNNPGKTLKSMPANSVKDIEVITNPGAKYDAEGVGGIINIVTQSGKGLEGYTATFDAGINNNGGWNAGVNAILKVGKLSVSGNYGYYSYQIPDILKSSSTEYYNLEENHLMLSDSRVKYRQPMQFGSAEASYEIDTLNLLTFTISGYGGRGKSEQNGYYAMYNKDMVQQYNYSMYERSNQNFGGMELSLNYQRTLSKKDELLTASYLFSRTPSGSDLFRKMVSDNQVYNYEQENENDAHNNEHTLQMDYVNPFSKKHSLETGVKYIYRSNISNSEYKRRQSAEDSWTAVQDGPGKFDHAQYILSLYAAYALKYKDFGLKAGARLEHSKLDVNLHSEEVSDFDARFTDVVPTVNLSYKLSDTKIIRAGYNLRISRPGIWYLNPYREIDPLLVSYGNPYLDSEKFHNVNANFSSFTQKLMVNLSLSYDFCNNSIQSYSELKDGTIESTYGNIGRQHTAGGNFYLSTTPFTGTTIWMNGMVNYIDIRSKKLDAAAYGWYWGGSMGLQQKLPWKIQLSAYGGYYSPYIRLQGENIRYYYYGMRLIRSFLKEDRLTLTLFADNFLNKYMNYKQVSYTDDFYQVSTQKNPQRTFGVNISYRLGDLKTTVKKVVRGIVNDDLKGGGGNSAPKK